MVYIEAMMKKKEEMKMTSIRKRYFLDGEIVNLPEFIAVNDFDDETVKNIRAMKSGEQMTFGGGAAPIFLLTCDYCSQAS